MEKEVMVDLKEFMKICDFVMERKNDCELIAISQSHSSGIGVSTTVKVGDTEKDVTNYDIW